VNHITGSGKHKKTSQVCTVTVLSPGSHLVSVNVTRGKMTYAVANAVVHGGRALVSLRELRAMKRGRYLVTVVATAGGHATVIRYREMIGAVSPR
jgi:hypothetical protein